MLSNQDLFKALNQNRREIVDVRLGAVPVQPTVSRGGQYQVAVRSTPKENAATQIAKALNQFPQIAGQYKNLQQQAGIKEVQEMDHVQLENELRKRAEEGDDEASKFSLGYFKKQAMDQEIYRQAHETKTSGALEAIEKKYENYDFNQIKELFEDENGNDLSEEQVRARILDDYINAIPAEVTDMVKNSKHQVGLHNAVLRKLPSFAFKSFAAVTNRQQTYLNDEQEARIESGYGDVLDFGSTSVSVPKQPDNIVITDKADVDETSLFKTIYGKDYEAAMQETDNLDISVSEYATNEEGGVLPTDYYATDPRTGVLPALDENARPPAAQEIPLSNISSPSVKPTQKATSQGPDGNNTINSLDAFRKGQVEYVTASGSEEFIGNSYVVNKISYVDAKGDRYTLANVPVAVHNTTNELSNAPEGQFDLIADYNMSKDMVSANKEAMKGAKFVKDEKKKFTLPLQYQKTAKDVTAQNKAAYDSQLVQRVEGRNDEYNKMLSDAMRNPGPDRTPTQIRQSVERRVQLDLERLVNNEEFGAARKFLDMAKNGQLQLGGRNYNDATLRRYAGIVEKAEEDADKKAETKLKERGEKLSERIQRDLAGILVDADSMTSQQVNDTVAQYKQIALKLRSENRLSEETYRNLTTTINQQGEEASGIFHAGGEGLYQTQEYYSKVQDIVLHSSLVAAHTGRDQFIVANETAEDRRNMDIFKKVPEGISLTATQREQWKAVLSGVDIQAVRQATIDTNRHIAKILQREGMRVPQDSLVPDAEGNQVRLSKLYETVFKQNYTEAARALYSQAKRQQELIDSANAAMGIDGKRPFAEIPRSPGLSEQRNVQLIAQQEALKIEQTFDEADLLEESGKITKLSGRFSKDMPKVLKTLSDPKSLDVMEAKNTVEARRAMFNDLYKTMQYAEYAPFRQIGERINAIETKGGINALNNRDRLWNNFISQFTLTGIPMDLHEKDTNVEYTVVAPSSNLLLGSSQFYPPNKVVPTTKKNFDFGSDYYVKPAVAKTAIYNADAIVDWHNGNQEKMTYLWNKYLKSSNITLNDFANYQMTLGRKIRLIPRQTTN